MHRLFLAALISFLPFGLYAQQTTSVEPEAPAIETQAQWQQAMLTLMSRKMRIPREMVTAGPWGRFNLSIGFTIEPDGAITHPEIVSGSGVQSIDDYALAAMQEASVPAFTSDMRADPMRFTLPIQLVNDKPEPKSEEEG